MIRTAVSRPPATTARLRTAAALVLMCCAPAAWAAPHPAVARIIVQENGATAFGSGSLIDSRDQHGLVITNWHVVRDAVGKIEVVFPDGFRSEARAVKLDEDWDLAALVIWRPPAQPVAIAAHPPRPGDPLTICGYGQGEYRAATGRCTEFYAPEVGMPRELVELSVEARQGDSGGPIFNERGELAGVLFGAANGTTLGSFAPRVETFLASVAPDIGRRPRAGHGPAGIPSTPALIAHAPPRPAEGRLPAKAASAQLADDAPQQESGGWQKLTGPRDLDSDAALVADATKRDAPASADDEPGMPWPERPIAKDLFAASAGGEAGDNFREWKSASDEEPAPAVASIAAASSADAGLATPAWFDAARNVLAVMGATFLFLQLVRIVS